MDMLFVTCDKVAMGRGTGCMVNIAYNRQLPLCASTAAQSVKNGRRVCRLPTDLCIADPDFRFNLSEGSDNPVSASRFHQTAFNSKYMHIRTSYESR